MLLHAAPPDFIVNHAAAQFIQQVKMPAVRGEFSEPGPASGLNRNRPFQAHLRRTALVSVDSQYVGAQIRHHHPGLPGVENDTVDVGRMLAPGMDTPPLVPKNLDVPVQQIPILVQRDDAQRAAGKIGGG